MTNLLGTCTECIAEVQNLAKVLRRSVLYFDSEDKSNATVIEIIEADLSKAEKLLRTMAKKLKG